ncbi:MAG TPA: pyridoxal phosphate-dependent aminotransferase [Burkholderiaceae bacterium]|jgi:histidinol-phosphate aminotransferase
MMTTQAPHGGPDSGPEIRFDFSTNANPYGPPPELFKAVMSADRQRYPDPGYLRLREQLAAHHEVSPAQIMPASGGAEAIRRLTLAARLQGLSQVWVPRPGFGDYAAAALALGLKVCGYETAQQLRLERPSLVWACDPCNPTGAAFDETDWLAISQACEHADSLLVVDQAYEPLRLDGRGCAPNEAWRLHCPNKALGLTGVRAAYLIAPAVSSPPGIAANVSQLAPSWVLSAEGVALLMHWHDPATLSYLAHCRELLRGDRSAMRDALHGLGWQQQDSLTPFWLTRPPEGVVMPRMLAALREQGIKLRDATSFGLPGWVRVAAQPAPVVEALVHALKKGVKP